MSKLTFSLCTVAAILLAGCANSSGVMKAGPDTFTVATSASPGKGGVPAAKRIAYEEAKAECSKRGLEVFTLSEKASSPTWTDGMANVELNFRCLRPDDAEFQRQKLGPSADKVIEQRSR